jgi:hypothetical protein
MTVDNCVSPKSFKTGSLFTCRRSDAASRSTISSYNHRKSFIVKLFQAPSSKLFKMRLLHTPYRGGAVLRKVSLQP